MKYFRKDDNFKKSENQDYWYTWIQMGYIETSKTEYDKAVTIPDLANVNTFSSKIKIVEQSIFGLLDLQISLLETEIIKHTNLANFNSDASIDMLIDSNGALSDTDKTRHNALKAQTLAYRQQNITDYTKINDLNMFARFLALSQTDRITTVYGLVINQGIDLEDAWKQAIAKSETESPIAKLGQGLHEVYSKAVLGTDLYNNLVSIFKDLDLGTHLDVLSDTVTSKALALAPKAPTDTSGIV